jgi:hypothetical protein
VIDHGTYLENVMFTTHVRLLGYGTQANPIEGCLSIPKGAMDMGTRLMTKFHELSHDIEGRLHGALGYGGMEL